MGRALRASADSVLTPCSPAETAAREPKCSAILHGIEGFSNPSRGRGTFESRRRGAAYDRVKVPRLTTDPAGMPETQRQVVRQRR